jgi:hypothetical protein
MEEDEELLFQISYIQINTWSMNDERELERGMEATLSDFVHVTQRLVHD